MVIKKILNKYSVELSIILLGSFLGIFLMFSTFSVENDTLLISTKVWSDFASHIPLIRSFSLGSNFLPQYPLFPGEPIKYHFIFYYFVAILEKLGVSIDIALNTLSAIGFTALLFTIYLLAKEIFKSKLIGIISVIFFIFNSSLSFIYFIKDKQISLNLISQMINNRDFASFAPYGPGIISAFWNLNIYTNQRHLALSFALSLLLIYFLISSLSKKKFIFHKRFSETKFYLLLGIIMGSLFFLHIAVFLMTAIFIFLLAVFFKELRRNIFLILIPAAIIAFPQYIYLTSSEGYPMHLLFGYLVSNNLTINKFFEFWIYNLGLNLLLIPLGFVLSNRNQKKIFLSFFSLFIIGNIIQFSPEIAANHKFFNYFIILGNMFSAFIIYKLWRIKHFIFKPLVILIFFFTIFGGLIDFFPIINDQKIKIPDYKSNQNILWIKNNTDPNSIFLNTTFLYDPASLAGRKIFLGWPYFAWSQGYNTDKRFKEMTNMLGANNKHVACNLLKKNNIDYIEITYQTLPDPNIPHISEIYSKEFELDYKNSNNNYFIYNTKKSCR